MTSFDPRIKKWLSLSRDELDQYVELVQTAMDRLEEDLQLWLQSGHPPEPKTADRLAA